MIKMRNKEVQSEIANGIGSEVNLYGKGLRYNSDFYLKRPGRMLWKTDNQAAKTLRKR